MFLGECCVPPLPYTFPFLQSPILGCCHFSSQPHIFLHKILHQGAKWSNGAVSNAFPGEQGGLRHYTGTIGPVITLIDLCHVMSYNLGLWMLWLLQYHDMTMAIIKKYEWILNVFESRSWEARPGSAIAVLKIQKWTTMRCRNWEYKKCNFYTKVMWSYVLFQTEEYFM